MPKIPFKSKKKDDDEIVSFESFCNDKSSKGARKQDSLTLNDNINYQLHYEKRNHPGESSTGPLSKGGDGHETQLIETSLSGTSSKHIQSKGKSLNDPNTQGKFYQRSEKYAFLNRMKRPAPKRPESSDSSSDKGLKYERFSESRFWGSNICSKLPGVGSGILVLIVVCVLCVVVWWGVWGMVGGAWGEEHYRRLWERAHPHHNQNHHTHYSPSVIVHQQLERLDPIIPFEPKYHDHNNLSTKNKNASDNVKLKNKVDASEQEFKKNSGHFESVSEMPNEASLDQCSNVKDEFRFDCFPEFGASEESCVQRGCCWIPHDGKKLPSDHYRNRGSSLDASVGLPYCFFPPQYGNYHYTKITETRHGMVAYLEKQFQSSYPDDVNVVIINVKYLSDDMLEIKISDAEKKRFEPPYPEIPTMAGSTDKLRYRVVLEASKLGFKIVRVSDGTPILDSQDLGGFIFSNKFLQISFLLPSDAIYGLGEHQGRLLVPSDWQRYTLFNYDTAPVENKNLYGSHPFYLVMEKSGLSHGVLLLNSNAMDVVVQPAPAITFRSIGGIFHFLIMLGPEPSQVISQYTSLIGRPFMPPYWSLGFHLCKYDYGSLNKTREVWQRTRNAGIPFDVQWNDLDYMNNSNIFTYDKKLYGDLPKFVKELHDSGMHYIPLIDPGVSASEVPGSYPPFDKGMEMNVFIKNSSGQPFVGKVWNKASTVWPDFTHPNTTAYWESMLSSLHKSIPFDGLWIDMNEPSNFLSGPLNGQCSPEILPYLPGIGGGSGLRSGTLCMDAKQYGGEHYNLHNLYSLTEAITTNYALSELLGTRPFIISRSSFPGLGKFAGHWSGDIFSEWYDMKMSIPQMLSFSLYGIPMMGSDICGFNGNTTVELCRRWMELGAFYPFSRNHNSDKSTEQDPVILGPMVVDASLKALTIRYTMLPYLYTLFWRAHTNGDTVARPVFFEFPRDNLTYSLDQQFLWGAHLMIAPILDPGATTVKTYLPKALWYKYSSLSLLGWSGWGTLNEGETILIRGGGILPLQSPDAKVGEPVNTLQSRSKPLQLLVALDSVRSAKGSLFWDDGESLNTYEERKYTLVNFTAYIDTLKSEVVWWGYGVPSVNKIFILGQINKVTNVFLNKKAIHFTYDSSTHLLSIEKLNLSLDNAFTLLWK